MIIYSDITMLLLFIFIIFLLLYPPDTCCSVDNQLVLSIFDY